MDKASVEETICRVIRAFEERNDVKVSAINFKRQSMCDTDGQQIKTWSIELSL